LKDGEEKLSRRWKKPLEWKRLLVLGFAGELDFPRGR
jgi:hypothetical protein